MILFYKRGDGDMITNPVERDIDVYKDRDYIQVFNITDASETAIDLTDWTIEAQIRPTYGSDSLIADFTIETVAVSGTITMSLTATQTGAIDTTPAIMIGSTKTSNNMVWDMVVEDASGDRYSLMQGVCVVHETVTRSE